MKFLLPVMMFVASLSTSAFAQGVCMPNLQKYVFKDGPPIIKVPGAGDLLMGGWGSSGDFGRGGIEMMTMSVYVPAYNFKYSCQLQITDQVEKNDAINGRYITIAVAQFDLNNQNTIRHSDNLNWRAKRYYFNTGRAVDDREPISFSLANHSASIVIEENVPEDNVELTLRLSQPLGLANVTETASLTYLRSATSLYVEKALNITSSVGADNPRYMGRLFCERKL